MCCSVAGECGVEGYRFPFWGAMRHLEAIKLMMDMLVCVSRCEASANFGSRVAFRRREQNSPTRCFRGTVTAADPWRGPHHDSHPQSDFPLKPNGVHERKATCERARLPKAQ